MQQLEYQSRSVNEEVAQDLQHFLLPDKLTRCPFGCGKKIDRQKLSEHVAFGCYATI